ncbi:MAG: histidine phosphatase family protein [Gammaproteobacteria bacterium]|nr:MAG: histidine phosphatase family protein [Gammaproteobacteria bacterium]
MRKLHPSLMGSVHKLPDGVPITLFTRHSLRELPNEAIVSYTLPLTEAGVTLANEWGGNLMRPIASVHSSPVGRCIDTGKAMLEGAKQALDININPLLTEPGCYVQDMSKVGKQFVSLGPVDFIDRHFNEPWEGLLPLEDGCAVLLRHFYEAQGMANTLTIHVTHDTILAAFIYHLMGCSHVDQNAWPWMLEGAFLWFDQKKVHWIWRGELHSTSLSPYLGSIC